MELENVNRHTQQQPFHCDFFFASSVESSEIHIYFGERESTFSLNRAVDPKQDSFFGGNLLLHVFPLPGETL